MPELEHHAARLHPREGDVEFLRRVDLLELFDYPHRQGPVEGGPTGFMVNLMSCMYEIKTTMSQNLLWFAHLSDIEKNSIISTHQYSVGHPCTTPNPRWTGRRATWPC